MGNLCGGDLRKQTSSNQKDEKLKELQQVIDNLNAVTEEYNKKIETFEKELLEKHGIKVELQKAKKAGLSVTCELEVRDKVTGKLKEHKRIEGNIEKII